MSGLTVDVFDNTNLGTAGSVYITGHGIPGAPGAPETDLRVLAPTGSFVQAAVQIQSASCTGTTARITTAAAHQLRFERLAPAQAVLRLLRWINWPFGCPRRNDIHPHSPLN